MHNLQNTTIVRLYLGQTHDPELLHRAMSVSALAQSWKADLPLRAKIERA